MKGAVFLLMLVGVAIATFMFVGPKSAVFATLGCIVGWVVRGAVTALLSDTSRR